MSQESVFACIASLCSAYYDAAEVIQHTKANKASHLDGPIGRSTQALESSLGRGENAVRIEYERILERCGEAFAQGDRTFLSHIYLKLAEFYTELARDALQDIIAHLQAQVIAILKAQWEQDSSVDFIALQDTCDSIQEQAILVLMQLQQRTITLGPVDNSPYDSLSTVSPLSSPTHNAAQSSQQNVSSVAGSSAPTTTASCSHPAGNRPLVRKLSSLPSVPTTTPLGTSDTFKCSPRLYSERGSRALSGTDKREAAQYKPVATTVTTTGLFGIGKRTKIEPIVSPPENPLVDEYLAVAMEDAKLGLSSNASIRSRTDSIRTSSSSICEPDHPASKMTQDRQPSSPDLLQRPIDPIMSFDAVRHAPSYRISGSMNSYGSQRRASAATVSILSSIMSSRSISAMDVLPSENNEFAGFCKGAWRQQIGDRKRAMEERVRPGGMYNAAKYVICKQCKFEGRSIPMDKKKSGFDMRVFKLVPGIQFRWEFMFKSHVQVKEACSDPTKATFGCIFCCAEGRGTPVFCGINTFMNHLVGHRESLPTGDVLYRMNCLVGRQAACDEDFDINIISIEGGKI